MNAHTDSELETFRLLQTLIQVSQGSKNSQPSSYCSLRIVFMGVGIAEIDEQTVTKQLGDMPIVALNNVGTYPLIGTHHVTPVFRVELRCELRRVHQVAEHHGELAAFSVGKMWDVSSSGGRDIRHRWSLGRVVVLGRTL